MPNPFAKERMGPIIPFGGFPSQFAVAFWFSRVAVGTAGSKGIDASAKID
jgi:hypothetical protein